MKLEDVVARAPINYLVLLLYEFVVRTEKPPHFSRSFSPPISPGSLPSSCLSRPNKLLVSQFAATLGSLLRPPSAAPRTLTRSSKYPVNDNPQADLKDTCLPYSPTYTVVVTSQITTSALLIPYQ